MSAFSYDAAVEQASKAALQELVKLQEAAALAKPIVGEIDPAKFEDATAIYKFVLDACGVDLRGVDPSAFGPMVRLLNGNGSLKNQPVAADSALSLASRFPEIDRAISRIKKL